MKCQFCGAELKDQARFCFKCGAQTGFVSEDAPQNTPPKNTETVFTQTASVADPAPNQAPSDAVQNNTDAKSISKKQKPKKKGKLTLICILSAIVLLIGALAAVFFTSSAYSVYQKMSDGSFDRALIEYRRDVKGSALQEMLLDLLLKNRAEDVVTDYKNGEVDHLAATIQLDALYEMGFEDAPEKRTEILTFRTEEVVNLFQAGTMDYHTAATALTELMELGFADAETHRKNVAETYANTTVSQYEGGQLSYQEAMGILEQIQADGYIPVGALIDRITAANDADNTMLKAEEYYENGQYENAIDEYSKIPESDKNYQAAQDKLNEVYLAYVQNTEKSARSYIAAKNYKQAIKAVDAAYEILPDGIDTSSLDAVREESITAYKSDVADQVATCINAEQWPEAFSLIDNAIAFDNNDFFQSLRVSTEDAYVTSITTTVHKHLGNAEYTKALNAVTGALQVLPNNDTLLSLKETVEKETPVHLKDAFKIDSKYYRYGEEAFTDSFGNVYDGYHFFDPCGYGAYVVYNLDRKYTTFNCSLVAAPSTHSDSVFAVYIYLDGELAYTVSDYTKTTGKVDISIDVSNSTKLEIKANATRYDNSMLAIVNAFLKAQ